MRLTRSTGCSAPSTATPTAAARPPAPIASRIAGEKKTGKRVTSSTARTAGTASAAPAAMPTRPPRTPVATASARKRRITWPRVAPRARRMPTSRVRSLATAEKTEATTSSARIEPTATVSRKICSVTRKKRVSRLPISPRVIALTSRFSRSIVLATVSGSKPRRRATKATETSSGETTYGVSFFSMASRTSASRRKTVLSSGVPVTSSVAATLNFIPSSQVSRLISIELIPSTLPPSTTSSLPSRRLSRCSIQGVMTKSVSGSKATIRAEEMLQQTPARVAR